MKKIFVIFGFAILLSVVLIAIAISDEAVKDSVCGMEVDPASAQVKVVRTDGTLYFCSDHCKKAFCSNPTAYMSQEKLDALGVHCPADSACKAHATGDVKAAAIEVGVSPSDSSKASEAKEKCPLDCKDCTGH